MHSLQHTPQRPPGPLNFNAGIGLTWRHAVAYWWNPLTFFDSLAKRYGDLVFFRLFHHRCYLINHPDMISEVLVDQRSKFDKWKHQMNVMRGITGDSLLTSEGPAWVARRKVMQTAFTSVAVERNLRIAKELAVDEIAAWPSLAEGNIEPMLSRLVIRMSTMALFGIDCRSVSDELLRDVRILAESANLEMFEFTHLPDWWPAPYKRRKRLAKRRVRDFVARILSATMPPDATNITTLLRDTAAANNPTRVIPPDRALDEAVTMLIAGIHSTSVWLSWTIKLIAADADLQADLQAELQQDSGGGIDNGPTRSSAASSTTLLDRVLKESLRLYPAAWALFARCANQDTQIGPYEVPRGSVVFMVPYVTQRDPRWFPDPLRFDPHRFTSQEEAKRPKGAYFPFGLGPHVCIGMQLGTQLVKGAVEQLLRNYRMTALPQESFTAAAHLALRPRQGVRVELVRYAAVKALSSIP